MNINNPIPQDNYDNNVNDTNKKLLNNNKIDITKKVEKMKNLKSESSKFIKFLIIKQIYIFSDYKTLYNNIIYKSMLYNNKKILLFYLMFNAIIYSIIIKIIFQFNIFIIFIIKNSMLH